MYIPYHITTTYLSDEATSCHHVQAHIVGVYSNAFLLQCLYCIIVSIVMVLLAGCKASCTTYSVLMSIPLTPTTLPDCEEHDIGIFLP